MSRAIKLNVGGQLFEVSKETLLKLEDTYFSGLLNGKFGQEKDDVLFIDRNPEYFKVILEFLRSGLVLIPDHLSTKAIEEEAEYFHVAQHMFKNPPEEVYLFDKEELYDLGGHKIRHISTMLDSSISVYITWNCDKSCHSYVSIYEDDKKIVVYYPHNLITGPIKRMFVGELHPRGDLKIFIGRKKISHSAKSKISVKSKIEDGCDGKHIFELVHHMEINESCLSPKKKRKIEN